MAGQRLALAPLAKASARLCFPLLLVLWAGVAAAATVVAIDKGDTLRVREGGVMRTVRLACVEAPELGQQPHGARAKATLERLVPVGTAVILVPHPSPGGGTAVAEVVSAGGNVNLALVRAGQVFGPSPQQALCDPLRYPSAENSAQWQWLGVWDVPGGIQRPGPWRAAKQREEALRRQRLAAASPPGSFQGKTFLPTSGLSPSPAPTPQGAGAAMQQQCVALVRQQFRDQFPDLALPEGYANDICACVTAPGQGVPGSMERAERCAEEVLARYVKRP